nr:T-cell surface protein tactile isoform X3 [Pogona vitticeps]
MDMRQTLQTYYFLPVYFLLLHLIRGQSEIIIKNEKMVYALPGENVTLTCNILKEKGIHVTQTQWSKVSDVPTRRIAVYNPLYGTIYSEKVYSYSVNFRKDSQHCMTDISHGNFTSNYTECNQWILQFKNVSLESSGKYECSFTTFPAGASSSEINLVVMKIDVKSFVVEALLNQTLEIPCIKDLPSENLRNASLTWLLQKENENEEILISKPSYNSREYITRTTMYKDRIESNSENTLIISPVSVFDDGKKFVCSVSHHPGRIMKTTTEVKVFVKPEISISLNASFTGKATFTCVIKKAFPKPELLWYLDGEILKGRSEGIVIQNEDTKVAGGFYEMRSLLIIWKTIQTSHSLAVKCMSVYPFLGNETRNISSGDILLPRGWQPTALDSLKTNSHIPPSLDSRTEKPWHFTKNLQNNTQTKSFSDYTVSQGLKDFTSTTQKTSIHVTHLRENITASQRNLSTKKAVEPTTLVSPDNPPTVNTRFNNNGTATFPRHNYFSWPALVAALLFFCTFLILLGIRKWCQYQKEIMNRPPSFKPPPPPVKYTSMQGFDGTYTSCNELENL